MSFLKKLLGTNDLEYEEDAIVEEEVPEASSSVVYPADKTETKKADSKKPEFVLVKPASRDELGDIAKNLMNGKTVVLNLELVVKDCKRFVDFLSGVVFALDGTIKKIAGSTYLIIPGGVSISGDIFDDFEEEQY